MSNSRKLAAGLALVGACAAVAIVACESVPLTAAPGTSMTLIANPPFVIANGGVSVVTAILVEPAGTFVPDGTEVFFFTNLGRIDARGKTVNGVARVNFVSDSRSGHGDGDRDLREGRPRPPGLAPTPGRGDPARRGIARRRRRQRVGRAAIAIAERPARRGSWSRANPQRITSPRQATITATVLDEFGNPVQNVPVAFSISGSLIEETLESGGAPRFTDSNGQALRHAAHAGADRRRAEDDRASRRPPPTASTGSVTVFID